MRWSRKQIVKQSMPMDLVPTKVLLLQTAKEILAEIFSTDISDVGGMIRMRREEKESWPEGLGLRDRSGLRFWRELHI